MKISYAITVCTEVQEFKRLLDFLVPRIRKEDEIIVLQDISKDPEEVNKVFIERADDIECRITGKFADDFAEWKNDLNAYCTGDYIFQLDADELPAESFIESLPNILEKNSRVDLFWVPRSNLVEGLTENDIRNWGWIVDKQGRVNWPDYQGRIYRNSKDIKWVGKVHEKIEGHKTFVFLPDKYFLHHDKTIAKQRQQNEHYSKIQYGR